MVYLKYMDYVTIEKIEVSSDEFKVNRDVKIIELELMLRALKEKLDKVVEGI